MLVSKREIQTGIKLTNYIRKYSLFDVEAVSAIIDNGAVFF